VALEETSSLEVGSLELISLDEVISLEPDPDPLPDPEPLPE